MSKHKSDPLKQLRNRIFQTEPLKIVLGAGDQIYPPDWICTNVEELDVTDLEDWCFLFEDSPYPVGKIDLLFAEHVWEHLTYEQAVVATKNAFSFLKPGGTFRIAVPDGNFPDPGYIDRVRPGGTGAGATDHKILWTYQTLSKVLQDAGFQVELLEFWDSGRKFNYNTWDPAKGKVLRSLTNDDRNRNDGDGWMINYTSIIIDAIKPLPVQERKGVIKVFRRREIEGKEYFNLDDFISCLQASIEVNTGELKEALQGQKIFYLKLAAELDQKAIDNLGEYSEEKLLPIEETMQVIAREILDVGEDSVAAGAYKVCLDMLIQIKEAKDTFSEN
jgi:predicted SAM-dependent methyltransferase